MDDEFFCRGERRLCQISDALGAMSYELCSVERLYANSTDLPRMPADCRGGVGCAVEGWVADER